MSCPAAGTFLKYDGELGLVHATDTGELAEKYEHIRRNIYKNAIRGILPHFFVSILVAVALFLYFPASLISVGAMVGVVYASPRFVDVWEAPKRRRHMSAFLDNLKANMRRKRRSTTNEPAPFSPEEWRLASDDELAEKQGMGDPVAEDILDGEPGFEFSSKLQKLYASVEEPEWVDWEMIAHAADVYERNCLMLSFGLTISLVESFLFPEDAQVLVNATGLARSTDGVVQRLMQTGYWIWLVMRQDLRAGGRGYQEALNIRFLHVRASRLSEKKEARKAHPVSLARHINQANMAGTLILFCQTSVRVAELRGAVFSSWDKECLWHRWRYIGHLIGIDCATDLVPLTYAGGLEVRRVAFPAHQRTSSLSKHLTMSMLDGYEAMPIVFYRKIFQVVVHKLWTDSDQAHHCPIVGLPSWGEIPWRTKLFFYILTAYWYFFQCLNVVIPLLGHIQTFFHVRALRQTYNAYFRGAFDASDDTTCDGH